MPVYEYCCQDCERKFEIKATVSEKEKGLKATCPQCGSSKTVRVFASFSTFSKGGGSGKGCCGPDSGSGCCG